MSAKDLVRKCPICGCHKVRPDPSFKDDFECFECGCPKDDDWPFTVVPHILVVSRYDPRYFVDRAYKMVALNDNFEVGKISYAQVPFNLILCDGCNAKIKEKTVGLLVLDGSVWGAVCKRCRARHYPELPVEEDLREKEERLDLDAIACESVSSESVISTCPCKEIAEPVCTATFVVYDEEEGGYIRYMSFDEKCQLCGKLLNSFGDVDWNATAADYKIYLEKRDQDEGGNVVICTYCWDRFVSEPELVRHLSTNHANAVLREGCG